MKLAIFSAILFLTCIGKSAQDLPDVISVNNGGVWGHYGPLEWCLEGDRAVGFSLKVETGSMHWDLSAINGIRLFCANNTSDYSVIESTVQE